MEVKRIVTYNPEEVTFMLGQELKFDFGQLCKDNEPVSEEHYKYMLEDALSAISNIPKESITSRLFAKGASWVFRSNRPVYYEVTYQLTEEDPPWI